MPEAGAVDCIVPLASTGGWSSFRIVAPQQYRQAYSHFGASVAVGQVSPIGSAIEPAIIVGVPDFDAQGVTGSYPDQGIVIVFYGPWVDGGSGPHYSDYSVLNPFEPDLATLVGLHFGHSLATGTLNQDYTPEDILVGIPYAEDASGPVDSGAVDVFLDIPKGSNSVVRTHHLVQDPTYRAAGNHFGWAVGMGSLRAPHPNTQYVEDIVVGAPETLNKGVVQVFYAYGDSFGVPPTWDSSSGNTATLFGYTPVINGRFGASLAIGNTPQDMYEDQPGGTYEWSDLAVGAPGRLDSAGDPLGPEGSVHPFFVDPNAPANGVIPYSPATTAIITAPTGYAAPTDLFGYSLRWVQTQCRPTCRELVVGAPGVSLPFSPGGQGYRAGRVIVYDSTNYLTVAPSAWPILTHFSDPTPNGNERFGWSLESARDVVPTTDPDLDDIVIGAPRANIPSFATAGELYVWIY